MKKTLAFLAGVVVLLALAVPVRADDPIGGALATLAAATAQAQAARAAQAATRAAAEAYAIRQQANAQAISAAISAESTRQFQSIQATATARAMSAEATSQTLSAESTRKANGATATAAAMNLQSTRAAQEATATVQAQDIGATATSQAVAIAAQATDAAKLSQTYATRQERFTLGLLLVEIFFVCGSAWTLWKLARTLGRWADRTRPRFEPLASLCAAAPFVGPVVIDLPHEAEIEPRMPSFVQVVDNPEMENAIARWAEKFDTEHGGDNE